MFIYEGTNNLVSGAFLKCFSIQATLVTSTMHSSILLLTSIQLLTSTRNVVLVLEIYLVAYATFWLTQENLETAEVLRVYAALNPQEEQICLY